MVEVIVVVVRYVEVEQFGGGSGLVSVWWK